MQHCSSTEAVKVILKGCLYATISRNRQNILLLPQNTETAQLGVVVLDCTFIFVSSRGKKKTTKASLTNNILPFRSCD